MRFAAAAWSAIGYPLVVVKGKYTGHSALCTCCNRATMIASGSIQEWTQGGGKNTLKQGQGRGSTHGESKQDGERRSIPGEQ